MRILVCGGRDFDDYEFLKESLDTIKALCKIDVVIEGDARGADTLSRIWAENNNIPVEKYPANWKRDGRAAGLIRNQQMLDEGKPNLVIAFEGGTGTQHMINISKKAGIPVKELKKGLFNGIS